MGSALLARLAAGIAGAGLAVTLAAPAAAEEPTPLDLDLDAAYENTAADDHTQRCAEGTDETDPDMVGLAAGEAGWYFTAGDGEIDVLEAAFAPGGDDNGEYEELGGSRDDHSDDPVTFHDAGAYVVTPLDWVLVTASATVTGGEASSLVVTHTCVKAAAADEGAGDQTGTPNPGVGEGDRRGLPVTGAQVGGMVVVGFGLLSAGFAMTAVRRRRDLSHLLEH